MSLTQKDLHQYLGNIRASIALAALLLGAPAQAQTPAGADWTITTVAGTGDRGYSGDGGPAVEATLGGVADLAVDGAGNLYIAEDFRIRRVDSTGTITTIAGLRQPGADEAMLGSVQGVAMDGAGNNLYIAYSNLVRKLLIP